MLSVKWDLLSLLIIAVTVFNPLGIAANQAPPLTTSQTVTGQLDIIIADNFETGVSERRYAMRVKEMDGAHRWVPLSFASILPDTTLRSGDQITVEGRWVDSTLAVDDYSSTPQRPTDGLMRAAGTAGIAPLTIGDRKAIILILNMRDVNTNTVAENQYDEADLIAMMYTGPQNVKGLYEASSYDQLSFDPNTDGVGGPDVFGPYTIDYDANADLSTQNQRLNSIINEWAEQADALAKADGKNIDQYQHHVYFLPREIYKDWLGMGTEGCPQNSCRAWVIESANYSDEGRFLAHELGHNLDWKHAASDPNNDGAIGQGDDYGDASGIMGWPVWAQANAPHRDQLEWFDAYPGALVTAKCSTTDPIQLHALELDPGVDNVGTQVIKIRKPDTNDFYYLSYRREIGPYPSNPEYAGKINIHRYDGNWSYTYHITNLEQNGVFRDNANGIIVRAAAAGGAVARVRLEIRNAAPEARFSHTVVDDHLRVRFNDNSTDDNDDIASYQWEIDGQTVTDQNPVYTFPNGGEHPVTLTVTDGCGNADVARRRIVVVANEPPVAAFSSAANHLDVQFADESQDSDGTPAAYQWDFGDGQTSQESDPSHTYTQSGNYEVTLTVTDDDGDTGQTTETIEVVANKAPEANFTSTANGLEVQFTDISEDSDGQPVSHQWKFFDDDSISDLPNPKHVYSSAGTYKVQLTVTDDDGASDTEIKEITVNVSNVAPTADFSAKADRLSVVFVDASADSDGSIESYRWDFGDNTTSTEAGPSHTYAEAGTYDVTFTVTDNNGATGTVTKSITVDVNNVPPEAAFTYSSDGLEVQFSNTSTDTDGSISLYEWDFGDGSTSAEMSPLKTYTEAGTYTVRLTVTDNQGASNTLGEELVIDTISPLVVPTNQGGGGGGGGCFILNLY